MTEQEIPKELKLEQNKFVQSLFQTFIKLQKENQLLKAQIQATNKPQKEKEQYFKEKGVVTRVETMTTHREMKLVNSSNKACCNLCDSVIGDNWRQRISLEACNPNCAAYLEMLIFQAINKQRALNVVNNNN